MEKDKGDGQKLATTKEAVPCAATNSTSATDPSSPFSEVEEDKHDEEQWFPRSPKPCQRQKMTATTTATATTTVAPVETCARKKAADSKVTITAAATTAPSAASAASATNTATTRRTRRKVPRPPERLGWLGFGGGSQSSTGAGSTGVFDFAAGKDDKIKNGGGGYVGKAGRDCSGYRGKSSSGSGKSKDGRNGRRKSRAIDLTADSDHGDGGSGSDDHKTIRDGENDKDGQSSCATDNDGDDSKRKSRTKMRSSNENPDIDNSFQKQRQQPQQRRVHNAEKDEKKEETEIEAESKPKPKDGGFWSCPRCTLRNDSIQSRCEACDYFHRRPSTRRRRDGTPKSTVEGNGSGEGGDDGNGNGNGKGNGNSSRGVGGRDEGGRLHGAKKRTEDTTLAGRTETSHEARNGSGMQSKGTADMKAEGGTNEAARNRSALQSVIVPKARITTKKTAVAKTLRPLSSSSMIGTIAAKTKVAASKPLRAAPLLPPKQSNTGETGGRSGGSGEGGEMWTDKHAPTNAADLVVAPKKVQIVRQWLEAHAKARRRSRNTKRRRPLPSKPQSFSYWEEDSLPSAAAAKMMVLTGAPGVGKSATVKVLAAEVGAEVRSWNSDADVYVHGGGGGYGNGNGNGNDGGDFASSLPYKSQLASFGEFLARAGAGTDALDLGGNDGGDLKASNATTANGRRKRSRDESVGGNGRGGMSIILIEEVR